MIQAMLTFFFQLYKIKVAWALIHTQSPISNHFIILIR